MPDRAYTVAEVDALRRVVEHKWLFGSYGSGPTPAYIFLRPKDSDRGYSISYGGSASRSYREEEKSKAVEERTRTHMLAGHTADDLIASEIDPNEPDLSASEDGPRSFQEAYDEARRLKAYVYVYQGHRYHCGPDPEAEWRKMEAAMAACRKAGYSDLSVESAQPYATPISE